MAGFFITFEGPDGSGKTTQLRLLTQWFRSQGVDPVLLRQPGGTPLGERIRAIVLDSRTDEKLGGLDSMAELALMFADRAQSIAEVILPALQQDRVVLCDRYTDSSEVYQGAGRGLGSARVLALHAELCGGLQPDLTVLLLPDVEKALLRARHRNERAVQVGGDDENRFERAGEDFFRRVHAGYATIAAREPQRVVAIRGNEDIETVAKAVRETVAARWHPAVSHAGAY
jgi:dTMP kinase